MTRVRGYHFYFYSPDAYIPIILEISNPSSFVWGLARIKALKILHFRFASPESDAAMKLTICLFVGVAYALAAPRLVKRDADPGVQLENGENALAQK